MSISNPVINRIGYNIGSILCIVGCITDIVLIKVFGDQIPGYNQLTCTLSSLGISSSPVAQYVTVWSVILGFIFFFFGFTFRKAFHSFGRKSLYASWLIVLYALGEDIASGILKDDHINGMLTVIAILHNILGGIGVIALLTLPLAMIKIFTRKSFPVMYFFSIIVMCVGIISIVLFSFRIDYFNHTFLNTYSGIWQRSFLINYYFYFIVIAIKMFAYTSKKSL